jgi:Asp-tRNA(Asn)/Glu-tRNA(Gln) amidotransferase A subunit family amidase
VITTKIIANGQPGAGLPIFLQRAIDEGSGMNLIPISASQAARAIKKGEISSKELVEAYLERIHDTEDQVQAWTYIDPDYALEQAKAADQAREKGLNLGCLHGVPVGIKDIFDTHDMPTQNGTVLHESRQPDVDAAVVARLREAGAVIMGKTVTTELAVYAPGKTRNPHNTGHTPGGSSSGSAAGVAAGMIPLALGTQTNGSMIRPASYCGVYGFKPSHGRISRFGVLSQSHFLDQIGVYGRCLEDVALIAQNIMFFDSRDPSMIPRATPPLLKSLTRESTVRPRLAFARTPVWDQAEAETASAFGGLCRKLGKEVDEIELPPMFDRVVEMQRIIMETDLARSFAGLYERGKQHLSTTLAGMIEKGQKTLAVDYNRAVAQRPVCNDALGPLFEKYDAIMAPATTGSAPKGLDSTGSPIFCTIWTYCGCPAISLPLLKGENGMPLGLQLVGPKGGDAKLMRVAKWLVKRLNAEEMAPAAVVE